MIGKAEWFKRRKWGGWGLSPASWQGWAYIGVWIAFFMGTNYLPVDQSVRTMVLAALGVVLFLDTIAMMVAIKKDERETLHEALAERNALWMILLVLVIGLAYETARSVAETGVAHVDPVIMIAIFAGLIVKAGTNYYLDKKN